MPEALLKTLAGFAREVKFQEDEIVYRAGERSECFCLLVSGNVSVEISSAVYTFSVQTLGPGDTFGWSSLLSLRHTVFQARARDASTAICLKGERLSSAALKDPELGSELFRRLSEALATRVRATELRLAEFCGCGGGPLAGPPANPPAPESVP